MIAENLEVLESRLADQEIRLREARRIIERYRVVEKMDRDAPILAPGARAVIAQAIETKGAEIDAGHDRIAEVYTAAQPLDDKAAEEGVAESPA